jgi:hypothetical protein
VTGNIKRAFIKAVTVLHDKFKPESFDKLFAFIFTIKQIDPSRFKFTHDKHLRGCELYSKDFRQCPITRIVGNVTEDSLSFPQYSNHYQRCRNQSDDTAILLPSLMTHESIHSLSPFKV